MSKNKIADSIIIRVGGGIREVPRESADNTENQETTRQESGFEAAEDAHPFGVDLGSRKIGTNKIIN